MTTYTLTLIDVRRVQSYLFNANELRQNLGASMLVEQATHQWIIEALPSKHNIDWSRTTYQPVFNEKTIDGDRLDAEVIFMGGGNAAILFSSKQNAVAFTRRYTKRLLIDAPGLEAAVGHVPVEWERKNGLKDAWKKLQEEIMPMRKEGRAVTRMLPGLAVTAEGGFTGQPAVEEMPKLPGNEDVKILVSAEARAKREPNIVDAARERLEKLIPPPDGLKYPDNFENLGGEKGYSRYIAVVHVDGNGMGKRIQNYTENADNREMVKKMRSFSNALNKAGLSAMRRLVEWMYGVSEKNGEKEIVLRDRWNKAQSLEFDKYIPIRPIIFGGDDMTFVCEGRLGITLAVKILEFLYEQSGLPDGNPVYGCTGVAIVHSHYPFARAYALAENLGRGAKKKAREYAPDKQVSLIHWHISSSGLTLDWDDIQEREYKTGAGDLILRPLIVKKADSIQKNETSWRTWSVFKKQVEKFRADDAWQRRRNKRKELREILRQGPGAVRDFTKMHGDLPAVIAGQTDYRKTGWYSKRCVYFDALDADDWFIYPDDGKEGDTNA